MLIYLSSLQPAYYALWLQDIGLLLVSLFSGQETLLPGLSETCIVSLCYENGKSNMCLAESKSRVSTTLAAASLDAEPMQVSRFQSADVHEGRTAVILGDKPLNKYLDLYDELNEPQNGQVNKKII